MLRKKANFSLNDGSGRMITSSFITSKLLELEMMSSRALWYDRRDYGLFLISEHSITILARFDLS